MEKIQVLYEQMIQDDDLMRELEDIIEYSTTRMKTAISNGTEIYEFVEDKLTILPVGIMPVNSKEGYFLLCDGSANATRVYSYYLSFFEKHDEKYQSMRTEYIDSWQRSFTNTYEQIKSELLHRKPELPHPAARHPATRVATGRARAFVEYRMSILPRRAWQPLHHRDSDQ
jgi:hypothetical protein